MASQNRIDSIYDVAKITAEQQEVEKLVRASIEQIKQARSTSIDFNVNTKSIVDYNAKIKELNASVTTMNNTVAATTAATKANTQATQQANGTLEQNIELRRRLQNTLNDTLKNQREDIQLLKSGVLSRAEYNKRLTESQAKIAIYKQKIQELNRVIKEDIAVEGRAGDAYKQLSAEYNRAALAAKNYQITLGKTNPITVEAVAKAKGLSDQLKAVDAAVGQNTRNVGNYAGAIGQAFSKAFSFLRTAANIIPGLGISGLLLALTSPLIEFTKQLINSGKAFDEVARNRKIYNDVQKESIKGSANEIVSIDGLISAARNENASREDRNKAIKILQDQYPEYLKNISLETINSKEAQEAIDKLKDSVLQKAVADAYAARIAEAVIKNADIKQRLDKQEIFDLNNRIAFRNKLSEAERTGDQATISALKRYGLANDNIEKTLHGLNKELNESNSEIDFLKKGYDAAVLATLRFTKVTKDKQTQDKKGKDIAEANRKAQFEILKAQIELDKEFDLIRANDEKRSLADRLTNLISYGQDSQRLIEAQAKFDLGNAELTSKERQKIENDKNNALIRLSQELNDKLKKITQDSFEAGQRPGTTNQLPASIRKFQQDFKKLQDEAIKNQDELEKRIKDSLTSLATELEGLFFDIFTNQIEVQKNAVQDQIDLLEQQKQKDIEVANQTITNAQDRADAIAVIEARAAAKRQQLELRQRQLDQQKARFEKARAVAEIIQSTSIAVVNALGARPFTPANIALAAIVGALGGVQIARVLAQPIPRYKDGTENHPGGPAIVGDGGKSETVVLPDGSLYRTPSKDTLVDLPKGSKVIPDYQSKPQNILAIQPVDNTDKLMQGFASVVYAVKRIPQPIIRADRAWTQAHKIGSSYRNYLNRSI